MRIIDISQPLHLTIPVWPGDQPFEPRWSAQIARGSTVNVGAVTMSLHSGTHADAPLHVRDGAEDVGALPLDAFIGPALVIEALGTGPIGPEVLSPLKSDTPPRILFKTGFAIDTEGWTDHFSYLSTELCHALVEREVRLVGIDTPSVDHATSTDLESHHILYGSHIYNLENLSLSGVVPGAYTLVALPLALLGMDASPVRAVLIQDSQSFER